MQHQDDRQPTVKTSPGRDVTRNQLRKLERENNRLKLRLKKTEGLIELQKKALELWEDENQDNENSASNS